MKASEMRERFRKGKEDLVRAQEEGMNIPDRQSYGSVYDRDKFPEGFQMWRCEPGKHIIDVVPFFAGPDHPRVIRGEIKEGSSAVNVYVWVYKNVGPMNLQIVAPFKNYSQADPIAEYISSMRGKMTKSEYSEIAPKDRLIFLIYCRDSVEEMEKGIQGWDISPFFIKKNLESLQYDKNTGEIIPYTCLEKGMSIYFEMSSGMFTDEKTGDKRKRVDYFGWELIKRKTGIPDNVVEQIFPLDSIIKMRPTYEEIKEAKWPTGGGQSVPDEAHTSSEGADDIPEERFMKKETKKEVTGAFVKKEAAQSDDNEDVCDYGHVFGVSTNKEDECTDCVKYARCDEENDQRLEKAKSAEVKTKEPVNAKPRPKLGRRK